MLSVSEIKKLIRSRSLSFVRNSRPGEYSDELKEYEWEGHKIFYRAGMADGGILYNVLLHPTVMLRPSKILFRKRVQEYWVPQQANPSVILDIGGNIGVSSVYYSHLFPDAKIYTFEPVVENYEILKKNIAQLSNVTAFNVALGTEDKVAEIYMCDSADNTGGFSLYDLEVDKNKKQEIQLKNAKTFLAEKGIRKVDIIKIDTEGAEYDILTSLDQGMLSEVKWITGELHGERDFELLAYLSRWFDIGINKSVKSRLFNFIARNTKYKDQIPWK